LAAPARRPEFIRLWPKFAVAVQRPRRYHHETAASDGLLAKGDIFTRVSQKERDRRVKPKGFLNQGA
jgi:hypothetical protein